MVGVGELVRLQISAGSDPPWDGTPPFVLALFFALFEAALEYEYMKHTITKVDS